MLNEWVIQDNEYDNKLIAQLIFFVSRNLFPQTFYICAVKKFLKITVLLNISILCCFVISIYNSNAFTATAVFSKSGDTDTECHYSAVSSNLFCLARTESSVGVSGNIPFSPLKNSFRVFSAYARVTEHLLFNRFLQYDFYSRNLVDRFHTTDIIFPFHYFW